MVFSDLLLKTCVHLNQASHTSELTDSSLSNGVKPEQL